MIFSWTDSTCLFKPNLVEKLAIFFTCDSKVEKNYLSNKLISNFGSIPQNIDIFIIHDTIKTKAGKFIYHLKDEDLYKNKINLS